MPGTQGWMVCHARTTSGEPCKAPVIRGAKVCRMHGGAAGHVREAAKRRLEALVEPSISKLRVLMLRGESHAIQLKAAESILDRAGIVATQQVEVDNQVSITVSYQDVEMAKQVIDQTRPGVVYEALPEPSNGQNGHQKAALQGGDEDDLGG